VYTHCYSLDGSSDTACGYHYCSKLLCVDYDGDVVLMMSELLSQKHVRTTDLRMNIVC